MIEPTTEFLLTHNRHDPDDADDADNPMANLPPKERAWAYYCQGHRSPEISRILKVPERTVRYWLTRALQDLEAEHQEMRTHYLDLATDRQRQIAAAAWQCYERAIAIVEDESSKQLLGDTTTNSRAATLALSAAARHLAVIAAADRELARLHDAASQQLADQPHHQTSSADCSEQSSPCGTSPVPGDSTSPHENAAKTATDHKRDVHSGAHRGAALSPRIDSPGADVAAKAATPMIVPYPHRYRRQAVRIVM